MRAPLHSTSRAISSFKDCLFSLWVTSFKRNSEPFPHTTTRLRVFLENIITHIILRTSPQIHVFSQVEMDCQAMAVTTLLGSWHCLGCENVWWWGGNVLVLPLRLLTYLRSILGMRHFHIAQEFKALPPPLEQVLPMDNLTDVEVLAAAHQTMSITLLQFSKNSPTLPEEYHVSLPNCCEILIKSP